MSEQRETTVTAGPGGVMTDEVGAITGEVTVRTELADDGGVVQRVQYLDAAEWYVISDSATSLGGQDLDAVHDQQVQKVREGAR